MPKFTDFTLPEPIQRAIVALNFITPTSIQELAIPWLMDNDQDLIALAQTGTGKTAAFGFPAISRTDIEKNYVQTLILCPTRELCLQITKDFESFSRFMPRIKVCAVYGGAPIYKQKEALKGGVQIVVGTPGRVYDMINQGALVVDKIDRLILDEADEMLNMGFKDELFNIMDHTPPEKQVLLFSATMNKDVEKLANTFMKQPHRISVGDENKGVANILHYYYKVHARDKYLALKRIADMSPRIYGIVFCRTRTETQDIANKLQHDGYNADALHGDLSQGQRELVMTRFRSKYVQLLIATDVAARGLDVDDLTHIINYHIPTEPDVYIHRSGRTGRAGKEGISISIVHHKEIGALRAVEKHLGRQIEYSRVPGGREICEKQLLNFIDTVERIELDKEQIESFLPSVYKKLGWLTREELIQRFVAIEFNRFLNYYKDTPDLDNIGAAIPEGAKKIVTFKTFRLNIGHKQELNKRDLMRYINRLKVARSIEIGQINIFDTYCTIELDSQYEQILLKAFAQNRLNNVQLEVSVSETTSSAYATSSSKPRSSAAPREHRKPYPSSDAPRRDNKYSTPRGKDTRFEGSKAKDSTPASRDGEKPKPRYPKTNKQYESRPPQANRKPEGDTPGDASRPQTRKKIAIKDPESMSIRKSTVGLDRGYSPRRLKEDDNNRSFRPGKPYEEDGKPNKPRTRRTTDTYKPRMADDKPYKPRKPFDLDNKPYKPRMSSGEDNKPYTPRMSSGEDNKPYRSRASEGFSKNSARRTKKRSDK